MRTTWMRISIERWSSRHSDSTSVHARSGVAGIQFDLGAREQRVVVLDVIAAMGPSAHGVVDVGSRPVRIVCRQVNQVLPGAQVNLRVEVGAIRAHPRSDREAGAEPLEVAQVHQDPSTKFCALLNSQVVPTAWRLKICSPRSPSSKAASTGRQNRRPRLAREWRGPRCGDCRGVVPIVSLVRISCSTRRRLRMPAVAANTASIESDRAIR